MVKEIEVGAKTIKFLSNGVTPVIFKRIFKDDLLKMLDGGESMEIASDKVPELAFVMAMQAEKTTAELMQLSYEMYFDWLMQFEPLDLTLKGVEIANIYISDSLPNAEPKKKDSEEQNE